jgi:hypothetical protein
MIDRGVTAGEQLCSFINRRLLAPAPWNELRDALGATGRPSEFVDFFRQIAAVTTTGRIVTAGTSLAETHDPSDPEFRTGLISLLREYFGITNRLIDEVYRFSSRAILAARESIKNSTKSSLRTWAMNTHPHCYMCGTSLSFDTPNPISGYTCEHVWPRAYGGDSITENLLPACASCNSAKKAHFATWTMPPVQSLVLGLSPAASRLQEIDGSYKFALHYRAAQRLALEQHLTLKQAFLRLGPWKDVRVVDDHDVADIFNLENHTV